MNHKVVGMSALLFFLFFSVIGGVTGIADFPPPKREIGISLGNETATVYNEIERYTPTSDVYYFNVTPSENDQFKRIENIVQCSEYETFDWTWFYPEESNVSCTIVDAEEGKVKSVNHTKKEEYQIEYDYTIGDAEFNLSVEVGMFSMLGYLGVLVSALGGLLIAGANIVGSGLNIPHSFIFSMLAFFTFVLYLFYLVESMFNSLPLIAKAVTVYPMLIALVYSGLTAIRD